MLNNLTKQLKEGKNLTESQVSQAVQLLIDQSIPPEIKAGFLVALAQKGETPEEIAAFAVALRNLSLKPRINRSDPAFVLIDVCGTGGDGLNTFNISSAVAIVVASAGVKVAKHGNRAVTSKSGSADVYETLGIKIDLTPDEASEWLDKYNFAFFFAPRFHPAFKHIAPARRLCAERGSRTIFNYLGPLLNPAEPNGQMIGVPNPDLCEPMARVLQCLGVRRGIVVCGKIKQTSEENKKVYLDEASTLGYTHIAEFYSENPPVCSTLSIEEFPIKPCRLEDIAGGDSATNAKIIQNILSGNDHSPKRDIVLLNSAVALVVSNKAKTFIDGWQIAGELIDRGYAIEKLNELVRASK